MKNTPDKFTRQEAQNLTSELKACWHETGQLHLRLYNGIDKNEPIYMTKPQVKEALAALAERLTEIAEKYCKEEEGSRD